MLAKIERGKLYNDYETRPELKNYLAWDLRIPYSCCLLALILPCDLLYT